MPSKEKIRKALPIKEKEKLLNKQYYQCANNPINPSINLKEYKCPMWIFNNGYFDESGYDFDHINELSISKDNSINNYQILCPCCHRYKTKVWNKKGKKHGFTSTDLHRGCASMDIDIIPKVVKKRKRLHTDMSD